MGELAYLQEIPIGACAPLESTTLSLPLSFLLIRRRALASARGVKSGITLFLLKVLIDSLLHGALYA